MTQTNGEIITFSGLNTDMWSGVNTLFNQLDGTLGFETNFIELNFDGATNGSTESRTWIPSEDCYVEGVYVEVGGANTNTLQGSLSLTGNFSGGFSTLVPGQISTTITYTLSQGGSQLARSYRPASNKFIALAGDIVTITLTTTTTSVSPATHLRAGILVTSKWSRF